MRNGRVAVSCHNCSRRRLRCDRSKPGCHKCTAAGFECPGYDRILTWVEGCSVKAKRQKQGPNGAVTVAPTSPPRHTARISSGTNSTAAPNSRLVSTLASPSLEDSRFDHVDEVTRLYMEHFENRVCKDLVAHDHPGANPFRQLIPLALEYPFLLHILVATSALHLFNTLHCTQFTTEQPPYLVASVSPPLGIVTNPDGPVDQLSKTALTNALAAKHRAICSLRLALDQPDPGNREVILTAILFFINFELIDVGNGGWQPHLRGAGRLMALIGQVQRSRSLLANRLLFDVVISDCLIYHILGSTLSPEWLTTSITHQVLDLFPILERTEAYSYLCCPAALLKIILATSQLSVSVLHTTDEALHAEATSTALGLLNQALALDTGAWAASLHRQQQEQSSGGGNVNLDAADADAEAAHREHVASAHRSAACLYILQAVPSTRALGPISSDDLVTDILAHLERVGERDAHFKATSWPTFVAGAETRDPETRTWLLGRLLAVWRVCPWGYIFTAVGMLKKMWELRDARDEEGSDRGRVSGLRELWAMHLDCLVI